MELKDLKVGDKVIISTNYIKKIGTVERITPKGFICVGGRLFNKDTGRERKSDVWFCSYIKSATEEEIDKINKANFTEKVFFEMKKLTKISYEQAVAINKILHKGGDDENI